jgi:hypothetical protein
MPNPWTPQPNPAAPGWAPQPAPAQPGWTPETIQTVFADGYFDAGFFDPNCFDCFTVITPWTPDASPGPAGWTPQANPADPGWTPQ